MKIKKTDQIVNHVAKHFRCFGAGTESNLGNPLSAAMKDKPPCFALGVDVQEVVEFVLKESRKKGKISGATVSRRD